jgi:23S rRNA (pseudouridine1915-N3)-methyltransferase
VHVYVALALGVVAHTPSIAPVVRLIVVCVGKIRPPFADDVAHYERLISRLARLETIELPESDPDREGAAILKRVSADGYLCALDREGRSVSSDSLAGFVEDRRAAGRDVWFAIGGPFGLSSAVLERAADRVSLGAITLPHQLARVVLLEQLFRAHKIVLGQRYHY